MSRKDENLNELAQRFYGEEALEVVRDMDEAEQMFVEGAQCDPASEVIEKIKAEVKEKCRQQRRHSRIMRIWQVGAIAASILAAVILWNGLENKPDEATVVSQVWNDGIDDAIGFEAQVSAIENNTGDLQELVFDADTAGWESELESEITELSGSFWEG